jgi:hypothetical protein
MAKNRKAAFPLQAGTLGKTASITQTDNSPFLTQSQLIKIRRFIKIAIVRLSCWDLLPAALTVLLLGGLRHD